MSAYLEAADAIGRALVEDAIWEGERCNWVGALPDEGPHGSVVQTYVALSSELYGGTCGVGLFLAELFAATGDETVRTTAFGALAQALSRADSVPPSVPGLHAGRLGYALGLARAGMLLDDERLVTAGRELVLEVTPGRSSRGFDLMSGVAGAVVGMLAAAPLIGSEEAVVRASGFGELLLRRARRGPGTLAWPFERGAGSACLTGLSHGAAGAGVALLELYAATGARRWRDAGLRAFAYERELFDEHAGNWPDLRRPREGTSFGLFWCHGAPGIALSRLRALALADEERREAELAVRTTLGAVRAGVEHRYNFSLCHGLAGNAEVLLYASDVLGDGYAEAAIAAADAGLAQYGGDPRSWPSGSYDGYTPSLFLGLAGVGRFYLRLHDPALPSLLLVEPGALLS